MLRYSAWTPTEVYGIADDAVDEVVAHLHRNVDPTFSWP
jgi:hypothetical protein